MIAHKYHAEFVTIVLESFQVCYYLFFHRSAILVNSTQSCFLWKYFMTFLDFGSKYFEILAKALSCRAALRQQALMWSLKVKRLSMMTPSALTDFSGLSMVFSSNFNSKSSVGYGDNTMNIKLCRVRFIPLLPNHSTAILQSLSKLDKTPCKVDDEYDIELSSA